MASEAFIQGGQYYGPGAGLVLSGNLFAMLAPSNFPMAGPLFGNRSQFGTGLPDVEGMAGPEALITELSIDDYRASRSIMGTYLSSIATNTSSWKNISAEACRNEYQACRGRRQYHDVLMVLEVHGEPDGYNGCTYLIPTINSKIPC